MLSELLKNFNPFSNDFLHKIPTVLYYIVLGLVAQ